MLPIRGQRDKAGYTPPQPVQRAGADTSRAPQADEQNWWRRHNAGQRVDRTLRSKRQRLALMHSRQALGGKTCCAAEAAARLARIRGSNHRIHIGSQIRACNGE